jgi:hypothetical protein
MFNNFINQYQTVIKVIGDKSFLDSGPVGTHDHILSSDSAWLAERKPQIHLNHHLKNSSYLTAVRLHYRDPVNAV